MDLDSEAGTWLLNAGLEMWKFDLEFEASTSHTGRGLNLDFNSELGTWRWISERGTWGPNLDSALETCICQLGP